MAVSEYRHQFYTWEVYPRVYHFQNRFKDVYNRFFNITGKSQYSFVFKKSDLFDDLTSFKTMLEKPLEIYVIGRENLDTDDLVKTSEPLQSAKDATLFPLQKSPSRIAEDHGITLVIVHVQLKDVGENGKKEVLETMGYFVSTLSKTTHISLDSVIIACHTNMIYKASVLEEFRHDVEEKLEQSFGMSITDDQIVFGARCEVVSTTISNMLELRIMKRFFVMKDHLKSFDRNNNNVKMKTLDIVETEQLIRAVQAFLKNGLGFVDILEDSQGKGERFEEVVLRHLMSITRCSVLDSLAMKFNLTPDACNQIAHYVKLEDKMKGSVSKNTRYHLSKIQTPCEEMQTAMKNHNKRHTFPGRKFVFIAYPLKDDIRRDVSQFEKDLELFRRTVNVMKKMIFEINGNIKQSILEDDLKSPVQNKTFTDELRKNILSIDGVYGTGTIFGEWEIHVQNEHVTEKVMELMTKFKVKYPVRVRKVIKAPQDLAGGQVEHGGVLEGECPGNTFKSGTLGTFADGNIDELYALTCGHVVDAGDNQEHNVYIKNGSNERQLFAKSCPALILPSGQQPRPFVDIAAVKVIDSVRPKCTKFLKDDNGMMKSAVLATEPVDGFRALYIFKYGAASHLTKGIVCSDDFTIAGGSDYLILISPRPGGPVGERYANPGDSGSINCIRDVDNNKTVKVVSMLSAGPYQLDCLDEEPYVSFQLSKGLEKLRDTPGGIQLNLPSVYSGQQMY